MTTAGNGPTTLRGDGSEVGIDPADGCRVTSVRVDGHELMVTDGDPPWWYGGFVMAPWAGRLRGGVATWEGEVRRFPITADGHASHGLVHSVPWSPDGDATWRTRVSADAWLGPLDLRQSFEMRHDGLTINLVAEAVDRPVPVTLGWHPWFRREVDGCEVELRLPDAALLEKDSQGIQTARRVSVGPGPYNDAFVGHDGVVGLRWPNLVDLQMRTDGPVLVIYNEHPSGVCVEPQTGPPDEVNLERPRIAAPGSAVTLRVAVTWSRPATAPNRPR